MAGIDKAVGTLVAATSVAHVVFVSIFVWRIFMGSGASRLMAVIWAFLALGGLVLGIAGRTLLKYGGKTAANRWGVYCVGASTALAGLLLVAAY